MKVRGLQILAVLMLGWSISGLAADGAAEKKDAVKEWAVLPHLPKETLVVLSLKDASNSFERLKKTGLWKLYSHSTAQEALKIPLQLARGKLKVVKHAIGHDLMDLLKAMQGEVTIGLLGFLEEQNEKGEPIPDLLVAFQPRDKADMWMDEWERFVDSLNAKTENTMEISETVFGGANIVNLSHAAVPFEITYCLHEGVFLASLGPGRVENILAARAAASKKGSEQETFSSNPRYKKAVEAMGGGYDALLHLGFADLRKIPEIKLRPKNPQEEREWTAIGLNELNALSYGITFEGETIAETFHVDAPNSSGLLGLLGAGGKAGASVESAPKDAVAALSFQLKPQEIFDRIIEIASAENPGARDEVETMLTEVGKAVNLNLPQDLFAAFSGRIDFSLSVAPTHPKIRVSFPRPILSLGLTDPDLTGKILEAVKTSTAETMLYKNISHKEKVITLARDTTVRGDDPGQFCYAMLGNKLFLSLYPLALKEEINRLSKREEESLESTTEYQAVAGKGGEEPHALFYLDTGSITATLYSVLIPVLQMQQKTPKNLDINALPPAEVLAENLKSTLITLKKNAGGLTLESRSSTGLWATAIPTVAIIAETAKKTKRRKQRRQERKLTSQRKPTAPKGKPQDPPTAPPDF